MSLAQFHDALIEETADFLPALGFHTRTLKCSGRLFLAEFESEHHLLSVSYEPGDEYLDIRVFSVANGQRSDPDDARLTPRLPDLNARYAASHGSDTSHHGRPAGASQDLTSSLRKSLRELRAVLPSYLRDYEQRTAKQNAAGRIETFRRSIEVRGGTLLQSHGFRRVPAMESTTATVATMVFAGTNLALEFSLDLRDDDIDLEITRLKEGRLFPAEDGGYSASLFSHLVRHCGYRGSSSLPSDGRANPDSIDRAVDGILGLLNHPSARLVLTDDVRALPE